MVRAVAVVRVVQVVALAGVRGLALGVVQVVLLGVVRGLELAGVQRLAVRGLAAALKPCRRCCHKRRPRVPKPLERLALDAKATLAV